MTRAAFALLALLMAGWTATASAQGLGFGGGNGDDNVPLEVYADNGIEWHQSDNSYIARGNARAIKGNVTVYGDMLTAYYRKGASGNSEIWKVEAAGSVRIVSPDDTAYGDNAVYTIDDGALIMTGKALRLVTQRETITARDRLEYWEQKNLAVARGDALTVTDDGRRIRADTLTATFKPSNSQQGGSQPAPAKPAAKPPAPTRVASNGKASDRAGAGNSRLQRMDAVGNVVITTPEEVARGERGVYFEDSGIATLTGSVKITRGQNQLNGEAAEVNLRTGISKLVTQPGGSNAPVRALLVPEKRDDGTPAGPAGLSKPR